MRPAAALVYLASVARVAAIQYMPPTAMHTGAHVPILNALLRELARTWREAPELAERCNVDNMRFFLGAAVVGACGDRVGDADPELMAVGGPEELKAYGDAALRDTSDNGWPQAPLRLR